MKSPAKKPSPKSVTRKAPLAPSTQLTEAQQRDAAYNQAAEDLQADSSVPEALRHLAAQLGARLAIRRGGPPAPGGKCIVYWMQRAQRATDNHALDLAVALGNALGLPVLVFFAVVNNFPGANLRHYHFMNQGFPDIAGDCEARGVSFVLRLPPHADHERFFAEVNAAMVIGDENPTRGPEAWRQRLAANLRIPFWTVDADVVVPSRLLEKAQFSAAVARPRIMRAFPEYLHPFSNAHAVHRWHKPRGFHADDPGADITHGWTNFDRTVGPVDAWRGGPHEAHRRLQHFVQQGLVRYAEDRSHPERDATSRLSPYLHFGHIGPSTIAHAIHHAVARNPKLAAARDSYFNEVIVWRELSVNFVRYQPQYDSVACADRWAAETIAKHDRDRRPQLYTLAQLESASTYDELWNSAQRQMIQHGWMPNYLRMLWAKKIVEWTTDAATALQWTIHLNDKYFLDGRDPNGYSGVAWAVLGKFDRAWGERPVFGKRRYMSSDSARRKFDSTAYIKSVADLPR